MSDDTTSQSPLAEPAGSAVEDARHVPGRRRGMSLRRTYLARLAALALAGAAVTAGYAAYGADSRPTTTNADVTAGAAYAYY
ncbi:hypothetical protein GCM10018790_65920 [Kitasatospora xanthocidica]|uniref:hypothetical protein n=1 Tax=Kitasatospora xanthocidica TaxID=83382 RepID=UPI001674A643|nr:hypothetical protein [Kitasatospora xanthocidica]GHF78737.1 hypothetical protein GCM10018790_65920 [Kitasatospora xanthocidica]